MERKIPNNELIKAVITMLNEGHTVTLRLKGFSMRPYLENNRDKVLLAKPTHITKGDVVLAEVLPEKYALHRIVKIEEEKVTLLGDGNIVAEHCMKKDVKAFAVGFYRKGRNKLEKTNCIKWKCYSFLWMTLLPFRRILLGMYKKML